MYHDLIRARLKGYKAKNELQEENALKEILQEVILSALFEIGFFAHAGFQGGTALRIFHGLKRFSEDLDFILVSKKTNFDWSSTAKKLKENLMAYGISMDVTDRSKADNALKKMMLKDNSLGKLLELRSPHHKNKTILIKLEIDTNPPAGSEFEERFLNFPTSTLVNCQNLSSCFAGKIHALLCRNYVKGRDWFDLLWYIDKKTVPNFVFLEHALNQTGPWAKQGVSVSKQWCVEVLREKVKSLDWNSVKKDVQPFVDDLFLKSLDVWSEKLFLAALEEF